MMRKQMNKCNLIQFLLCLHANKIQIIMSDNMTEQLIKNNLYKIGMQQNRYNSEQFLTTFQKSNFLPSKSYSFREISDWSNRDRIQQNDNTTDQIVQQQQRELQAQLGFSKFSFLISKRHRIDREPSQNSKTKKFVELSPINVKFHSQKPKPNLKRGGNTSPKKQQQSGSFYQSHYEPLSLLYQLKTKQKKPAKAKQDELPFILPQYNELKLPKTERISSIMRLMKKNQQIRSYRQRWNCPQKFQFMKLP